MELHNLTKSTGTYKTSKRRGRGIGSGKGGHTTGRGAKGQKARTGYNLPTGFEGGQVPLFRRLPRMGGFKSKKADRIVAVSLGSLNKFEDGARAIPQDLVKFEILSSLKHGVAVKILGTGKLEKKLDLTGFLFSKSASEMLEKAGCKVS
jgi:large subunit ribosomal protein L15